MRVSLTAVAVAALIALPIGASLALFQFRGRRALIILMNALMGLPPVAIGLIVYLLFSHSGPLGVFGLIFTPAAMIIAQVILVVPLIAALVRQSVEDLWADYGEQLASLGAGPWRALPTLLWEGRAAVMMAILAGLGRAAAEVGGVMIAGGNIDHLTRVMTTAIALETSKGNLALALGLGLILIIVSLAINASVFVATDATQKAHA